MERKHMSASETSVEIQGEITGSRNVGMRNGRGERLREVFVLITEQDAQELSFGDLVTVQRLP